ncbi:MAG: MarR family transcriptional regulator [Thermaerobacter sp.]|nr:MarR family transcriptional regulator [Thermaerobacter sp.]
MTISDDPVTQQLFDAFMRVRKLHWLNWRGAGRRPSDLRALFCIQQDAPPDGLGITVTDISARLGVTSPTVTQLLSGLESQGLVQRRADLADRRMIRVQLTAKGDAVCHDAQAALVAAFKGLIDYLGPEPSRQLSLLLGRVLDYYHEHQAASDEASQP